MVSISKKTDEHVVCCDAAEAYYPYGTSLDIRDELVDLLGAGELAVGDEVVIYSKAVITAVSQSSHEEGGQMIKLSKSLTIQLTDLEIREQDSGDTAHKLYGDS